MFGPATRAWFEATFPAPTEVQRRGWERIEQGGHALLVAPTGSGKTLAAFLAGIDRLAQRDRSAPPGTRILYVSPLKALVYDIERNLRAPLAGIQRTAERLGLELPPIRVSVRTGDTPQRERQRHAREPGEILVTTPESLFLILGSQARATLATVETVIVDEVHALAPAKRGTHLALSLERLSELTARDPQRIGLSATVRPLEEIARFLGGDRSVSIVDASTPPKLDLLVRVPVPDMTNVPAPAALRPAGRGADGDGDGDGTGDRAVIEDEGGPILAELYDRKLHTPSQERGIWPAIYPEILDAIRANRSTIVFTNSRGLCERLAQRLNDLAGEELVRAHHGSVSHEKRREIEEGLKSGTLRGIVATSSLELGIDMGAVDLVILVESPGSVSRGLQRVGRAGHKVGETSVGRIFPKYRGDLLEAAVISARMLEGEIETMHVPQNALDVLAQQIVAICIDRDRTVEEIERIVHRASPFAKLTRGALESVLDMLSGRYPSADFADLRPLLAWDRARDTLSARRAAALVSRMNPGTIPDRGHFPVHLGEKGPRVGELDEEMVFESRKGDRILLGATTWRIEEITRDRVIVSPSPGEPGRLPFWKGEGPGRPIEIGRTIGAFLRDLSRVPREQAAGWIQERTPLDPFAAQNLAAYVHEQIDHTGSVPTDRAILVERFRDELGDWRLCILTPFGARVHAPWAMAIQRRLSSEAGFETQILYSEDGIVLRFADAESLPELESLLPSPEEVEAAITDQLADTALFAGLFRENAVRSLLLPRRRPTQRNPLWAQRIKSEQLLASVRRFPAFPVVLETYRQALRDVFDLPALQELLGDIRMRKVAVREVETRSASPFARSLVFAYVAAYMYEQDGPIAERRAQALTVDRNLLSELLGQAELRELLDPRALEELVEELQQRAPDRRARDADALHDLLRRLGDLTEPEIAERTDGDRDGWLAELSAARRAIRVTMAGESRWVVADEAGLYRDALGTMPPSGLPAAFLEPVERALEQIVLRFARHRGPFLTRELAGRYALRPAQVEPILADLERRGILVRGEIRPGGTELDWCDAEVLRRLKRRTLARLRHEVAPVDASALALFLPEWQGVGSKEGGAERLLEAIGQLEGLALPWSELCDVILPQRVSGFRVEALDRLSAAGAIVWIGRGALGPRDGRVALYLREHVADLWSGAAEVVGEGGPESTPLHDAILAILDRRGASFAREIEWALARGGPPDSPVPLAPPTSEEFEAALWDLAWAGRITNDTFAPLEEMRWPERRLPRRRGRSIPIQGGRWSRVESLLPPEPPPAPTERALAQARTLLERYGIVSREAAQAEDLPGGFSSLYRVYQAMEESGKIRRGYFVEGLSGSQFAHAGAVDRLRAARSAEEPDRPYTESDVRVLSAIDPANPYGALLPWPEYAEAESARPRRVAGADVLLLSGRPVLYVAPRAKQILVFPFPGRPVEEVLPVVLPALRRLPPRGGRRRLRIEEIDGRPYHASPYLALLRRAGFEPSYRGLIDVKG
ncbi:MAG: DEAD/DEAH box helicase [Candidatus Eisenbacteria bacterium]